MATSKVDTQQMRNIADNVQELAGQYVEKVGELYGVGEELDRMWDGDANDSFNTQMGKDKDIFDKLNSVICSYVRNIRDNAAEYDRSEFEAGQTLKTNTRRRI